MASSETAKLRKRMRDLENELDDLRGRGRGRGTDAGRGRGEGRGGRGEGRGGRGEGRGGRGVAAPAAAVAPAAANEKKPGLIALPVCLDDIASTPAADLEPTVAAASSSSAAAGNPAESLARHRVRRRHVGTRRLCTRRAGRRRPRRLGARRLVRGPRRGLRAAASGVDVLVDPARRHLRAAERALDVADRGSAARGGRVAGRRRGELRPLEEAIHRARERCVMEGKKARGRYYRIPNLARRLVGFGAPSPFCCRSSSTSPCRGARRRS